ncbi:BspA family leucine-rich repeat surface protein [Lactobacillus sp. YT155]|uniref:BspA family leucine-rich repeat surface protein n=1 Tax=Lactobacillus sp. YT155 TaxID=3060955 RepID=UPI00265EBDD2|nr:BspA family leucine-rich repeat surface protein [Lactobacillus sp. YT155]MDO1605290.1 BspA family leucine-rich repeat surface protein [Lactobacillus sp. YT155]
MKKKLEKLTYLSLTALILMPLGSNVTYAMEEANVPSSDQVGKNTDAHPDQTQEENTDIKTPDISEIIDKPQIEKKDTPKLSSEIKPFVDTNYEWGGLTLRVDDAGVLHIPGGTVTNPVQLSKSINESSTITKVQIEGNLKLIGNADRLFYYLPKVTEITGLDKVDTSEVTSMSGTFKDLESITSLDLSGWNTAKVTDMSEMFKSLPLLKSLNISSFDTSNVTNMYFMFFEDLVLANLNVSSFNTSKVTNMDSMFSGMFALENLDVSKFDTSNVTEMGSMFRMTESLTSLDVSKFNTANVTAMDSMFYGASSLTSLDVSKFNTAKVTNMSAMFGLMAKLTGLNLTNFNTSNVTNIAGMFSGDGSLTSLDVSSFDTSKVTAMGSLFNGVSKVKTIDVSKFNTAKVTSMGSMFANMTALQKLDLSNFSPAPSPASATSRFFSNNIGLKEIKFDKFMPSVVPFANGLPSGKWQNVGSGTTIVPKGKNIWNATELVKNYNPATDADTYVWQPAAARDITIKYVDENGVSIADNKVKSGVMNEPYSETPIAITGYTYKGLALGSAPASGKFGASVKTVIFEYTKDPVPAADVTVKYLDEDGDSIAADKVLSGNVGETYTSEQLDIDGYTFKEVQGEAVGTFTDTPQNVTYIYTKDIIPAANVTIQYLDENGNKIAADTVLTGNIGEIFTLPEAPVIKGYTYKAVTQLALLGIFTDTPQTFVYEYSKDPVAPVVDPQKPIKEKTIVKTIVKELPRTGVNENLSVVLSIAGITLISLIGLTTFKKAKTK